MADPTLDHHSVNFIIWTVIGGSLGAAVRVAIGHDRGEPQSISKIFASFASGTFGAASGSQLVTYLLGLPDYAAVAISFPVGLLALGFVYKLLDGKIKVPFLPTPTGEGK